MKKALEIVGFSAVLAVTSCTTIGPVNEQNWSSKDRSSWYGASQGSRLIPYDWLMALRDDSGAFFWRSENVARYRYLPSENAKEPRLPVGFVVDTNRHDAKLAETDLRWFRGQSGHERWVGMNCSACHTAELIVDDKPVRVDGGPTLADFQSFTGDLYAAVDATADDPMRWSQFAADVLGAAKRDTPANRALLKSAFEAYRKRMHEIADLSRPDPDDPRYGPGRVDAVGHILAKVAYVAKAPNQFPVPAGAPVSYPFLWNVPQHKVLQWNGIAPNGPIEVGGRTVLDAGALLRNMSEVIGVFADVEVVPRAGLAKARGFPSSIDVTNLAAMERLLDRLKPPRWPGAPLDPRLVRDGEALFRDRCTRCHATLSRDDLASPAGEVMTPIFGDVATDPWMACNAFAFQGRIGKLAGLYPRYFKTANAPDAMRPITENHTMLVVTTIGTLIRKKGQVVEAAATGLFNPYQRPTLAMAPGENRQADKPTRLLECQNAWKNKALDYQLLQYKGRPLDGIWATGPYLHNGSVRTLEDLLKPPAERATSFRVGSRRLDTRGVGYLDEAVPGSWVFRVRDEAGKLISGNDNGGHDYGNATLTPDQRRALIEYMKSI